jgi:hypothetical protein
MKKDYQSPELNITLFDEKNVLDDSVSGFWGSFDNFDDLMKAIAIGNNTYEE